MNEPIRRDEIPPPRPLLPALRAFGGKRGAALALWFAAAFCLAMATGETGADEEVARASRTVSVKVEKGAPSEPVYRVDTGKETVVRIRRFRNISGTNPVYPTDPVLNYDNQTVDDVSALKDRIEGKDGKSDGGCSGGAFSCGERRIIGLFGTEGASFHLNPTTSACDIQLPGTAPAAGLLKAFDVLNPAAGVPQAGLVLLDTLGGAYSLASPPAGAVVVTAGRSCGVAPGFATFVLRHNASGNRWRVTIEFQGIGVRAGYNFDQVGFSITGLDPL